MKLTLLKHESETADIDTFRWKPEAPIDYTPGQFLRYELDHDDPDDRGTKRYFSIASSPTEDFIQLTTRFNPQGSTFKKALRALQPGDTIEAGPAGGSFVLESDPEEEMVLVAGGIGITPYRSMLKFLHDGQLFPDIHLVYATRSPQDVVFKDLFFEIESQHHNLHVTYVFENEGDFEKPYLSGRLTGEMIADICDTGNSAAKKVYLSGPEPMIKALKDQLLAAGHAEDLVKTDYFPGYADR